MCENYLNGSFKFLMGFARPQRDTYAATAARKHSRDVRWIVCGGPPHLATTRRSGVTLVAHAFPRRNADPAIPWTPYQPLTVSCTLTVSSSVSQCAHQMMCRQSRARQLLCLGQSSSHRTPGPSARDQRSRDFLPWTLKGMWNTPWRRPQTERAMT